MTKENIIIKVSIINQQTKSEHTCEITSESIKSGVLEQIDKFHCYTGDADFTDKQFDEMTQKVKELCAFYQSLKPTEELDGFRLVIESTKKDKQ